MTSSNWNYCHYTTGPLKAMISFGGDQLQDTLYWMTVLLDKEGESKEIFQEEFTDLNQAVTDTNTKYGHWDFINTAQTNESEGGCGSCSNKKG